MSAEGDIKARLGDADSIVDRLPWRLGETEAQRKRSRGRVAALAHQVAGMLAAGWTVEEIRAALEASPTAADAPDPAAQEKRWRSALKQARHAKRQTERPPGQPTERTETGAGLSGVCKEPGLDALLGGVERGVPAGE